MYTEPKGVKGPLNFAAVSPLPDEAYCDNWIANNGLELLRGFAADKPWHLVLNFTGPHDPYDVTPAMRSAWQDVAFPTAHNNTDEDQAGVLERQQNYAAMIENIDRHLGSLLAAVEERGEINNTLVVFCSDHGEMLGDHNRWQKSVWHEASSMFHWSLLVLVLKQASRVKRWWRCMTSPLPLSITLVLQRLTGRTPLVFDQCLKVGLLALETLLKVLAASWLADGRRW